MLGKGARFDGQKMPMLVIIGERKLPILGSFPSKDRYICVLPRHRGAVRIVSLHVKHCLNSNSHPKEGMLTPRSSRYITLMYSLSDFSASIGLSKSQGAAISAFLNLGTAVGRPLIGFMSDRLGRMEVAGSCTMFCGLTCLAIWIPAKVYGVVIFFAIISGAVMGVFWMVSCQDDIVLEDTR